MMLSVTANPYLFSGGLVVSEIDPYNVSVTTLFDVLDGCVNVERSDEAFHVKNDTRTKRTPGGLDRGLSRRNGVPTVTFG